MHDGRVARTNLDCRYPCIFLERTRNDELSYFTFAFRGYLVRPRHRNHDVRLDTPAVRPLQCCGLVSGVAFNGAPIRPCRERVDIRLSQFRCVSKFADMGICKPWRHLSVEDRRFDGFGPGARAFERGEGHGRLSAH